MIPILYETTETAFISNGLGRLRDVISCKVTEERNGIYEAEFQYPVDGANYDSITVGRIIGVSHDETGDIQPFDIVSYDKPINGIVTFHCTHISYRQSFLTVTGSNIQSLSDAFELLKTSTPSNPFYYETDKTGDATLEAADGIPKSVRSMLGGVEGSILDTYGGEYEWDKFRVILHRHRGTVRDFVIRYGVNMTDYKETVDGSVSYSNVVPYWTDGTTTIVGDRIDGDAPTVTARDETIPLDVSDKFEEQPTKEQVEEVARSLIADKTSPLPTQNISVSFVRLQDVGEAVEIRNLMSCNLCDTITVVFPSFSTTGRFKIVRTVWDALQDKYESMELGTLSTTLAQALGIGSGSQAYVSTGGDGGDHEELTQAEYDALSESEKMNGTVYFITDAVPDNLPNYSSTPVAIAKLNGRTIYRKVFTGNTPNGSSGNVFTDSCLNTFLRMSGYVLNSGNSSLSLPAYFVNSSDYMVWYPQGGVMRCVIGNSALFNRPYVCIVDYLG